MVNRVGKGDYRLGGVEFRGFRSPGLLVSNEADVLLYCARDKRGKWNSNPLGASESVN
jgi:hypothetical protein